MLIRMSRRPSSRTVAVDGVDAGLLVGDVGLHDERAAAERADRRCGFIRLRARSVVDQRDIDARLRERRRDDGANALAAGDQGDPDPHPCP